MSDITEVTTDNFKSEILESDLPVLVDFWADWCGPCRMMAPIFHEVADELSGKMLFGKVNVDEQSDIAAAYGVMSIPTLLLFRDGKEIDRIIGVRSKEDLIAYLNNIL